MKKVIVRMCLMFCAALLMFETALAADSVEREMAGYLAANVSDRVSAVDAVKKQISYMDTLKKQMGVSRSVELITHYAEDAISYANAVKIEDWVQSLAQTGMREDWKAQWVTAWREAHVITLNHAALSTLTSRSEAIQTQTDVEQTLSEGNIETFRNLAHFITFETNETNDITLLIDPDIIPSEEQDYIQYICIKTRMFTVRLNPLDLETDLSEPLRIRLQDDPKVAYHKISVTIENLEEDQKLGGFFTLSIPITSDVSPDKLVMFNNTCDRSVASSPHPLNPNNYMMDGRVSENGEYTVATSVGKTFDDTDRDSHYISPEEAEAIRILTEAGILNGYPDNTFRAMEAVKRGHFVKALMSSMGKVDETIEQSMFPDLYDENGKEIYCFYHANTAAKLRILGGYPDGCFHAEKNISRQALCKIVGLSLVRERGYKLPINPKELLKKHYNKSDVDKIDKESLAPIALLWELEIIEPPEDRRFEATAVVSRAQMALIMSRFLQKLFP